ncbi:MAG TPA: helix-turn-helix domain-containing protein [Acidimicrobiales bacterium]
MAEPSLNPPPAGSASKGLTATEFASAVTAITSAFGDPTRRAIYLFAHDRPEGVTAAETAERFNLHANVARHHLDKLASGGYLEVTVDRGSNTGAGRPSKRYRATREQVTLSVPVHHDDILVTLLGRALRLLPPHQAEQMAEEVGAEYGRAMAQSVRGNGDAPRSFRTALHAVADALTAHGFAAHAEKRNGSLRIVAEHCPFGDAAIEHPVICAVDRGMVKGMLSALVGDASADLESSIPMGDQVCITTIST